MPLMKRSYKEEMQHGPFLSVKWLEKVTFPQLAQAAANKLSCKQEVAAAHRVEYAWDLSFRLFSIIWHDINLS